MKKTKKNKWKSPRYRQLIMRRGMVALFIFAMTLLITFKVTGFFSSAKGNEPSYYKYYYKYYTSITIMPGDSLSSLADAHMDEHFASSENFMDEIKIVNGLEDDSLTAGMNLIIPYYSSEFK